MITIFTPTYNRAHLLSRLKECLDNQTCRDFEWIIVDDGSTDNTSELVGSWQSQNLLYPMKYIKQTNQGKHIAFNTAVSHAKGEWFICVDSDDFLTENAVSTIFSDANVVSDSCVGIVYPRNLKGSNKEKEWEKIDGTSVDIIDLKIKYAIPESAIVMRVNDIKNIPFPKIKDEIFIPESWLYQKLIPKGNFFVHNIAFYVSEYFDDGLTKNIWRLWKNNPIGVLSDISEKYELLDKYDFRIRIIEKIKCIININTICMASKKNVLKNSPSVGMSLLFYFPSIFFYFKRFK